MRPNARIAARIEEFARTHFGTPTIGVHVRQTDNMSAAWIDRKGVAVSAIDAVLGERLRFEPSATIFLATDNRAVQKSFLRRYKRVVVHPKWHPQVAGEAIHGHYACPDKVRAAEDALIDLYLLSRCDFLVYSSRATFARCATYISRQPADRRVDVAGSMPAANESSRWIARRRWWNDLPLRLVRGTLRRVRRAFTSP